MANQNMLQKFVKGQRQRRSFAYSRDMLNRVVGERKYNVVSLTGVSLSQGVTLEEAMMLHPRCTYIPVRV